MCVFGGKGVFVFGRKGGWVGGCLEGEGGRKREEWGYYVCIQAYITLDNAIPYIGHAIP